MLRTVEINFLFFSFLINFVWEMLQMPLFEYPIEFSPSAMNLSCTKASIGDAFITIVSFWFVALIRKNRYWIIKVSFWDLTLFLIPGIVITICFEALATGPLNRWTYSEVMPTIPYIGTGLAPILQWLILPLLTVFIVKRQIR